MPLYNRSKMLSVRADDTLRVPAKKSISPVLPTLKVEEKERGSQLTERNFVFSASRKETSCRKKTLFTARGSRALLR